MEMKSFLKLTNFNSLNLFIFSIFPLAILAGNLIINVSILVISITFIAFLVFRRVNINFKETYIILLFLFFFSLLVNLIFTNNLLLSIPRVFKFFFIIFFILSFNYIIQSNKTKIDTIFLSWTVILLIVILDLIFEYFNGSNILGLKSFDNSRLGSFTGNESNIGNYFYGFSLFSLAFIYKKYPKKIFLNFLISLFLIFMSFLIGERANFIKTFMIITLFCFFTYNLRFKYKLISFLIIFLLIGGFISSNNKFKTRYHGQFIKPIYEHGISHYINNSIYGAHYLISLEIFKKNPLFGVGIKNFRVESFSSDYSIEHNFSNRRGNTHPHQVHFEFLSETGLFGYLSFLSFMFISLYISIKSYLKDKNIFQLCAILFVGSSILPLIPMGSFFTTYSSSIFWINYALMVSFISIKSKF